MNGIKIESKVHFGRGRRNKKQLRTGEKPQPVPGRIPRIAKLMALAIRFEQPAKAELISAIKHYFAENMDDVEVGDLKAQLLLDFFLQEIGPRIYNKAIADATSYMQEKVADMEGSCYEPS